ncbi:MAG: RtcB family protein [Candidatus Moraniibacteriota bacterium]
MYTIKKESQHKQIMQPQDKQGLSTIFHVADELMPEDDSYEKLLNISKNKNVFHHIAALTDIHSKPGRKNPTGSVVATEGVLMPQLNDSAPNCGMRMMKTPFFKNDFSEEKIDELFQELSKTIPTKSYLGTFLDHETILNISSRGVEPLLEKLGKDKSELENILLKGNMFGEEKITKKELFESLPRLFFRIAQGRLGILGAAGNHFLDLLLVEDILDEKNAKKLGVAKDQYVLLMHTGSGMFGQYASYFYMPKKKEHLSQKFVYELARKTFLKNNIGWHKTLKKDLPAYENKDAFFTISENSELKKHFLVAHNAAANHGFANRALLQIKIEETINKVFGKKESLPLVYDMSHISIMKENHFGKNVWVHRNGSVRAFGPKKMKGIKLYEETGEPVFVPSSMSTPAYLGVATDQNESTFFSAPHGTGKSGKETSEVPKNRDELIQKMDSKKVRLYNGKSKGIINQDSSRYKNIEPAIEGMKNNGVMNPVAKMRPVAVLMA